MQNLIFDLRYAVRTLVKSPVFSTIAILSLALGIGANTAIFTLLDQVLLRLLPVKDPEQLVLLTRIGATYGSYADADAFSYPTYKDFRDRNQVFRGVLGRFGLWLSLGYKGQTERVEGELVSGNYFDVLGVKAALGRTFTPEDDRLPGGHPLIVLSYDFWVNRFAADPKVLGQTLTINGQALTVIGVSQRGFDGIQLGSSPKIRIPVMMNRQMMPAFVERFNLDNRRGQWINAFGRLKPGVTREQAKASLQPLFHSILEMEVREKGFATASAYTREQFLKSTIDVLPGARGRPWFREQLSTPLWVLMALVGLVLLIACANVANLLLARAIGREKEIAIRLALGAGRGRIVRQLMMESLLLSGMSGATGLLVAVWANRLLIRFLPTGDTPIRPDLRILGFTLVVSILTGLLFGLAPALRSTRFNMSSALKEQVGAIAGSSHMRFRKLLVILQVFLSLLLLIGAGLFIRSLQNLKTLDPGFRTHNVIAFSIDPTLNGYPKERGLLLYRELTERLSTLPGAESAALAIVPLLANGEWDTTISVEGYEPKPGEDMNSYFNAVSPGYFSTLRIPLLAGREFLPSDEAKRQKVAIVNEQFARRYLGDRNPIGRRMGFGGDSKTDIEIIGLIKNAKYMSMREEIRQQMFVPYVQQEWVIEMTAYVRTQLDPNQMVASIHRAVHELDPNLPLFSMRTLEVQLDESLATERLIAILAAIFGLLATVLATIGLYGVMAYNVARRTREIGIRMALGALGRNVTWLVMKEVLILVGVGVAVALPTAWGLTRLVQAQLYGITPNDPFNMAAATLGLALVALLAGYIPALRATRIDPIQALRYE